MFLAMLKNRMAKAAGFAVCLILGFAARPRANEKQPSLAAATAGGEQRSTAIIDFRVAQIGAYGHSYVATVGSAFAAEDSAASRYPIWEYASSPQLPEALEFAAE